MSPKAGVRKCVKRKDSIHKISHNTDNPPKSRTNGKEHSNENEFEDKEGTYAKSKEGVKRMGRCNNTQLRTRKKVMACPQPKVLRVQS